MPVDLLENGCSENDIFYIVDQNYWPPQSAPVDREEMWPIRFPGEMPISHSLLEQSFVT